MGKFTPTITTSVEPHERIDADEYDLEAQYVPEAHPITEAVKTVLKEVKIEAKTCCEETEPWEEQYETSPAEYDTQRLLTALGIAFLIGGLAGTALFFTISGTVVE